MTPEEIEGLRKELLNVQAELILDKTKPELKELILERIKFLNKQIALWIDVEKDILYYNLVETCYLYYRLIETFY